MFVCIQLRRNQFSLILELTSYDTHFLAIAIFQISKHQNSTAYKTTTSTTSKYSTIPIHKPNTIKNPSHILFDYPFILSSRFTSIYKDISMCFLISTNLFNTLATWIWISVCNQFSRGVYSMLGAVSPDSFDTLHSYSNTFQMPFVTPWFPEKVGYFFVQALS